MRATFTRAARYRVEAVLKSPLRTGGADGDTECVLRDADGRPMIQGSSLAGALRGYLTDAGAAEAEIESLFGTQSHPGHLILSDGLFRQEADSVLRPRLRIDRRTGTAAKGGKYDLAHVETGSRFTFTLVWLGEEAQAAELETVESLLSALHSGAIRLGAQKANGFGRVSLRATKQTYNLADPADREAWLTDRDLGRELALKGSLSGGYVRFELTGRLDNVLVKSGTPVYTGEQSCIGNIEEAGVPVIPGSSFKGAVRSRAEYISAALGLPRETADRVFGSTASREDEGAPGCVRFEDTVLRDAARRKITRIRINRFTGGVIRGGLFIEEPSSSRAVLRAEVSAACPQGCLLLLYALRDLGLGLYNLGSGGSIGRGYLTAKTLTAVTPEGEELKLTFQKDGTCSVSDPAGLARRWRETGEVRS